MLPLKEIYNERSSTDKKLQQTEAVFDSVFKFQYLLLLDSWNAFWSYLNDARAQLISKNEFAKALLRRNSKVNFLTDIQLSILHTRPSSKISPGRQNCGKPNITSLPKGNSTGLANRNFPLFFDDGDSVI